MFTMWHLLIDQFQAVELDVLDRDENSKEQ